MAKISRNRKKSNSASVTINVEFLKESGINIGDKVTVTTKKGKLILTKED